MKFQSKSLVIFIIYCSFFLLNKVNAQISAVTEDGIEVKLFDNGTWKYLNNKDSLKKDSLFINNVVFTKNKAATFLIKSTKFNIGIYINPLKYKFEKNNVNPNIEYTITSKSKEIHGMFVTERISAPLDKFKELIIEQVRKQVEDFTLVSEQYRFVNGEKIISLIYKLNYKGMALTYNSYLFVNENGNSQFAVWTGSNLFNSYKNEMEMLLNGFVEIKQNVK